MVLRTEYRRYGRENQDAEIRTSHASDRSNTEGNLALLKE